MNVQFLDKIRAYMRTQPVLKAWIFGSYSRDEANEDSDVDLLVRYDRENHHVGLFTIVKIQQDLQQMLGKDVDLVEEGTLLPFAVDSADNDKILVYEREG